MLRTAFYTTMVAKETICDIQYRFIKRTNHDNASWNMGKFEICAHKYADISVLRLRMDLRKSKCKIISIKSQIINIAIFFVNILIVTAQRC